MAKLLLVLVCFLVTFGVTLIRTNATTYTVGDNSGWDVSTDLETWPQGKKFYVGDALLFQYSSIYSVCEVTRENYDSCNTSNVIATYTDGNTTIPLSKPGEMYFVCGEELYCLGGMKLQVNVLTNSTAGAPQAQSTLPQPSSKTNSPSAILPSTGVVHNNGRDSFVMVFLGFMATMLWMVQI
ncbi:Cu_bind_like domain-containing protein [Cephalotus follicularis]|uniref:Cu_bind_like domain-containing protein n=1 Tax=Cephalotus follicularis TaxID=3775 RepID=A0A1Q3BXQ7_CEPFO|nr:Cu_bind_like domain-containing protein [Cephalotus follicularis]